MRLLLIRHGQSLSNLAWLENETSYGDEDSSLSDLGQAQAQALARAFAEGRLPRPAYLMSSLMVRAVQTAAPLAAALGLPVTGLVDAHEVGGLTRPGPGRSELLGLCDSLVLPDEVTELGWYHHPVEARIDGWDRATRVVSALLRQFGQSDELVGLVSHGMFIQLLMRVVAGWEADLESPFLDTWFNINNTGTVLLIFPGEYGERCWIHWVNRTDHLRPDQLSE